MLARVPKFFKNFYFLTGVVFLVWMIFFDSNDFITQYQTSRKLAILEEERDYYVEKIQEVQKDRKELLSNPELLEKFAREKYLMKKPTEDLYIIVEKDEEELEAEQEQK
ncbi:septum formation initiator [Rufibacter sp. DG15C]|uniref:FtsB family cell division protein n=1 Tax=Rufibacter sp. DG15C TaxID=1379909 RepID=UPI00078B5D62|nr:septum formation initiator family protein [Rufibacter sp. DG15C]AMM51402.1 septum formation initiator [Rufibacter sp. DG15C]